MSQHSINTEPFELWSLCWCKLHSWLLCAKYCVKSLDWRSSRWSQTRLLLKVEMCSGQVYTVLVKNYTILSLEKNRICFDI